ncbi:DNA polymerase Y family protein [Georgenia sp. Z1491]|uniref:DNA polymerase Y family protein n=1 Tax=Georgenia sp. Z1491 TaxID=3416707 RepID=UPI003CF6EE8B
MRTGTIAPTEAMLDLSAREEAEPDVAPPAVRRVVLWVPDWPVAAAVTEGLVGVGDAVGIHDQRAVVVTSVAARRAGVRRGMRRRSAQQICPGITLIAADPVRDARAFEPVAQSVEDVVAFVEVLRPGLLTFPARGPVRHAGGEEVLAERLVSAVAQDTGAECQVGLADGTLAATLAARAGVAVGPGERVTLEFLAAQDVGVLAYAATSAPASRATAELVDVLRRLGLRTLGALAALDAADVSARFGPVGLTAHRLARGLDARPPAARRPLEDVTASTVLDPPAERSDVAAFAARALAEDLAERMRRRGVVCRRLEVRARTEDGAELIRTWGLDGPPTAAELTDRVRWQLEGWLSGRSGRPPSAPLNRLSLVAQEVTPAGALQDVLWGPGRRGRLQAERAALRVQGLLGPEAVLVPVLQGGRDPRSTTRLVAWGDDASPLRRPDAPWPGATPDPWPATVLDEPRPVRLLDADGADVRIGARGLLSADPAQVLLTDEPRRIAGWAGPWPVVERWWARPGHGAAGAGDVTDRDRVYLQARLVGDEPQAVLLVGTSAGWLLDAVYD